MVATVATIVAVAAAIAIVVIGTGGAATPLIGGLTLGALSSIAGAVAAVATAVSAATARAPDARGSVNQVVIGRNMGVPYAMGRTYAGGLQVYDQSAGTDNKDRT